MKQNQKKIRDPGIVRCQRNILRKNQDHYFLGKNQFDKNQFLVMTNDLTKSNGMSLAFIQRNTVIYRNNCT